MLQPKSGFFGGMGERGVGGSKCGSTAAVALVFREGGATKLLAANVGDARVLLSRKGKAMQLTIDHVPDRHVLTSAGTLSHWIHSGVGVACQCAGFVSNEVTWLEGGSHEKRHALQREQCVLARRIMFSVYLVSQSIK